MEKVTTYSIIPTPLAEEAAALAKKYAVETLEESETKRVELYQSHLFHTPMYRVTTYAWGGETMWYEHVGFEWPGEIVIWEEAVHAPKLSWTQRRIAIAEDVTKIILKTYIPSALAKTEGIWGRETWDMFGRVAREIVIRRREYYEITPAELYVELPRITHIVHHNLQMDVRKARGISHSAVIL